MTPLSEFYAAWKEWRERETQDGGAAMGEIDAMGLAWDRLERAVEGLHALDGLVDAAGGLRDARQAEISQSGDEESWIEAGFVRLRAERALSRIALGDLA